MPTNTITGELSLATKQIKFTALSPIITGENRTTQIKVVTPLDLQGFDIYYLRR